MRQPRIRQLACSTALVAWVGCAAPVQSNGSASEAGSPSLPSGGSSTTTGGTSTQTRGAGGNGAVANSGTASGHVPGEPGCGLDSAAFCDTFDAPSPGG